MTCTSGYIVQADQGTFAPSGFAEAAYSTFRFTDCLSAPGGDTSRGSVFSASATSYVLLFTTTDDQEDYVDKAVRFARGPEYLLHLRLTMRQRMRSSPLMRPEAVIGDLEEAYGWTWQRFREGPATHLP